VSDRTCCGCGATLVGRRPQTKWCSGACRQRKLQRDRAPRARTYVCRICGVDIEVRGRGGARTMCDACSSRWGKVDRVRAAERYECRGCGIEFTRPPTKGQRPGWCEPCRTLGVPVECLMCGKSTRSLKKTARFCSNRCWCAWRDRPTFGPLAPLPSTEVVHVGSRMRRPRPPATVSTGQKWIAGLCRRCDEPFVLVFPHTHSLYCSKRCSKADAKYRRRLVVRAAAGTEVVYRKRIFDRDGWRCQLCGRMTKRKAEVPDPRAPVLDHIVPLAAGGTHEPANVQCAHFRCNCLKSDGVHGAGEQLRLVG
jgi:hypothetical protein